MEALQAFINSEAGLALQGLVVVAFADFLTGAYAAIKDGTFSMDALAAFVRKHLLGRVFPIGTLLAIAYFAGPTGTLFMAGAITSAAAYVAETASSVLGNLNPPKESEVKEDSAAAVINPVPQD